MKRLADRVSVAGADLPNLPDAALGLAVEAAQDVVRDVAPGRIGLFGGSFNPPHLGHLALAQAAVKSLSLSELRWLPAGQPWQKAGLVMATAVHRAGMVQALMSGQAGMSLDQRELRRSGPSYTADTLEELAAEAQGFGQAGNQAGNFQPGLKKEWVLILGQDQLARLETWHRIREWLPRIHLAVAAREGRLPQMPATLDGLPQSFSLIDMPQVDVSSTLIRERLIQGLPVDTLVGPEVARYIEQHRLYRPN